MTPEKGSQLPTVYSQNPFREYLDQLEPGSLREKLWRSSADYCDDSSQSFVGALGLPEEYAQARAVLSFLSTRYFWPLGLDGEDPALSIPAMRFLMLVSGVGGYHRDEPLRDGFAKALMPLVMADGAFATNAPFTAQEVLRMSPKSANPFVSSSSKDESHIVQDPRTIEILHRHKGDALSPEGDKLLRELWDCEDFREALRWYFHFTQDFLNVCMLFRLTKVEKTEHFFQMTMALDGRARDHIDFLLDLQKVFPNSIGLRIGNEPDFQVISFATEVSPHEFPDKMAFEAFVTEIARSHGINHLDYSTNWDKDDNEKLRALLKSSLC